MSFTYDKTTGRAKIVVYAGQVNGRQRQRTKTWRSPTLRQAERERSKHEATLRDELEQAAKRRGTIAGLVDDWRQHRDRLDSPSTVRGRRAALRRIQRALGAVRTDDLTARQLDQWYDELRAAGLTPTTIHNHHVLVRAIVRHGWRWGDCSAAAVDAVGRARPPAGRARRPQPPTTDALRVLISTAPPDLKMAATIAAGTGMRRGEIIGLRWTDIAGGVLTVSRSAVELPDGRGQAVKPPKTGEPRQLSIDATLAGALAEHRLRLEQRARTLGGGPLAPDSYVIADLARDVTGRTPRRLGWLTLAWNRHAKRHGAAVRFHDVRHWHATTLLDLGHSVATVQRRLGHAKPTTTLAVYTHSVDASDAAAADAVGAVLAPDDVELAAP